MTEQEDDVNDVVLVRRRSRRYEHETLLRFYFRAEPSSPARAIYLSEISRRASRDIALAQRGGVFEVVLEPALSIDVNHTEPVLRQRLETLRKTLEAFELETDGLEPASLYLGTDDAVVAMRVYQHMAKLMSELGLEHRIAGVTRGSVWVTFKNWLRKDETREGMKEKLDEVAKTVEMYGRAQARRAPAEVDNVNAGTIADLITSAGGADLCVLLGQVYVLKGTRPDGSTFCVGGQLTAEQAHAVAQNPALGANPWALLQFLEQGIQLDNMINPSPADNTEVIESDDEGPSEATG